MAFEPKLLSMVLLQLGSVMISMTLLAQRSLEPCCDESSSTLCWPWGGWLCPSLDTVAGELALPLWEEITQAPGKDDLTLHHRHVPQLGSTLEMTLCSGGRRAYTEGIRTGATLPSLICHMEAWGRERCPSPHRLPPVAGERAGPMITRVGKLALTLTSCSTQENRPCTPPGIQTRADSIVRVAGELALRA